MSTPETVRSPRQSSRLSRLIFASRWLQLPLYLGLIAAQAVYAYHFWVELVHLLEPTHNERFIKLMDQHMPKWQSHRQLLNSLPVRHENWEY
mgnify:CR=1 FL=1